VRILNKENRARGKIFTERNIPYYVTSELKNPPKCEYGKESYAPCVRSLAPVN